MTKKNDPKPVLPPDLFWRVLLAGNVMSLGVLMFVFHRTVDAAIAPQFAGWLLAGGMLSLLPALFYHRRLQRRQQQQVQDGTSANARQLAQLNQVVVACALAELPGVFGCFYYLFSREWGGTLLLLAVTGILLLKARPR